MSKKKGEVLKKKEHTSTEETLEGSGLRCTQWGMQYL
jgi:hypothetical protein